MLWSGAVFILIGLALSVWAIFGDRLAFLRKERRRRCPRCWYVMEGVPSLTCPECGNTARTERKLLCFRRRWDKAALGITIVVLGVASLFFGYVSSITWIPITPSFILVRLVEDPTPPNPRTSSRTQEQLAILTEVWERYAAGELSLKNRRVLSKKQFGDGRNPVTITAPQRWPVGVPISVTVVARFEGPLPREFRAVPRFEGGSPIVAYDAGRRSIDFYPSDRYSFDGWAQKIGSPQLATTTLIFDATISEAGQTIWSGVLKVQTRISGNADQHLKLEASEEANQLIEEAIRQSFTLESDHSWAHLDRPVGPVLNYTNVSLVVEFMKNGSLIASCNFTWMNTDETEEEVNRFREWHDQYGKFGDFWEDPLSLWRPLHGDIHKLLEVDSMDQSWQVRFRNDPTATLENNTARTYWAGEFTIPLSEILQRP